MITDYYLDWAVRRPGPPDKKFNDTNKMLGLVCHSMEGYLAGSLAELDKPTRQASWHLSNALDGTMYQHYPFYISCWASGNFEANTRFIAIESEGVAGTPLNDLQVRNMLRLAGELSAWRFVPVRGSTLFEHREVATMWEPNAGPTSCPSHRYDGFFAELEEGMTDEERQKLNAIYDALVGRGPAPEGVAELEKWNADGESILLGFRNLQKQQGGQPAGTKVTGTFEGEIK